ncbi:MAG: outer membrane beta-barrel protein [Janthinobacterium lividum]
MKKLLLPALLSLAATAAHAQGYERDPSTTGSRNSGFGIKGGLTLSDLLTNGSKVVMNPKQLQTFHLGIYGQHGYTKFASLQFEVLYSRKGYQADSMGQKAQLTTRLDYVEIPVLFVGNVFENISFHIGPQVSFLTGAYNGSQSLDLDKGGYNRVDFGGIFGLEARVGFARLGARYDLSFNKVYKDGSAVTYNGHPVSALVTDADFRNQVVQVYLGIGIAH